MLLERERPPPVPFTTNGYVPTVTVACVVIVSAVLAFGVKGFVPNDAFVPDGSPVTLKVTGELKPSSPVT
jgi:hypothetical protein